MTNYPGKTCKDCKAYFADDEDRRIGVCTLYPPQVVVANGEILSVLPSVDGEHSRCEQIKVFEEGY